MGSPGEDNRAIYQRKTRSLVLEERAKGKRASGASLSGTRYGGLDQDRATEFIASCSYVERMQLRDIIRGGSGNFHGSRNKVYRIRSQIDDGCAFHPDGADYVESVRTHNVGDRNRRYARRWIRKIYAPENATVDGVAVRIKCINRIIHRGDV